MPGFQTRLHPGPTEDGAMVAEATFNAPAPPEVNVSGQFSFQIVPKGHWDPQSKRIIELRDMFDETSHWLNSILMRV